MKKSEIQLNLRILEFNCDPQDITIDLHTQPTRTWLEGQPVMRPGGVKHKQNGWELSSGIDEHAEFKEHIKALLDRVKPNIERFERVCNQYYTELSCAIYIYYSEEMDRPWINFTREETRILSRLGAEVDFDIYTLPGDEGS